MHNPWRNTPRTRHTGTWCALREPVPGGQRCTGLMPLRSLRTAAGTAWFKTPGTPGPRAWRRRPNPPASATRCCQQRRPQLQQRHPWGRARHRGSPPVDLTPVPSTLDSLAARAPEFHPYHGSPNAYDTLVLLPMVACAASDTGRPPGLRRRRSRKLGRRSWERFQAAACIRRAWCALLMRRMSRVWWSLC